MSISLEKRVEAAGLSLQKIAADSKIDLGDVCAQVDVAIDYSGSMGGRYPHEVQEALERMLALTLTGLDDDGVVPIYPFSHKLHDADDLTAGNYVGWVEEFTKHNSMGGTAYVPFLEKMLGKKKRFGGTDERNQPPFFHIIFTDGEPTDSKKSIEKHIVEARERPHFIQFVLLGNDPRGAAYLEHLNNHLTAPDPKCHTCREVGTKGTDKGIDNVGVTVYANRPPTDDTGFFNDTIREFFLDWLPAARQKGYTTK